VDEIALTKCMEEGDLSKMPHSERVVRSYEIAAGQHNARVWEYCMALEAHWAWPGWLRFKGQPLFEDDKYALDVGGAGSNFGRGLGLYAGTHVHVIDPKVGEGLEEYKGELAPLVFCISVIEHVENLEDFCAHLARVTAPGGLLFLTSDIWGEAEDEPDRAKWWWDRRRIFTPQRWQLLYGHFRSLGFALLGEADWEYHGALMRGEDGSAWGYSLSAMSLVKEI
jgi:hypothetical protein